MKTILITGASRGIGAAVVKAAARHYNVAFIYKKSQEQARLLAEQTGATAYCCDVSNSAEVTATIAEIRKKFGRIDVLVNNAGVAQNALFQDISDDEWRTMMGTNLDGVFYVTRAVVTDMISAQWGRIVNVSSMWGQVGASTETHYSAAKAGVIGLTKALAKELAPSNITVNAVAPGAIDTDMMRGYTADELKDVCAEIPLGRLGTPDEIASAVMFLIENGYITGQVLGVNGGAVI